MIQLYEQGGYLINGTELVLGQKQQEEVARKIGRVVDVEEARKGTMSYGILKQHDTSDDPKQLRLKYDLIAIHDVNGVNVLQSARASGLTEFPLPVLITNCHNALCAVGGTLNEDDHKYLLSAAKKYGGMFVPPGIAIIHQYMREMEAAGGKMILTSDSHTRYGPLGTIATGEGGGELVKQMMGKTYDFGRPKTAAVYLTGAPQKGIGPHDLAIAIIGAVYKNGFVNNCVMEFVGDGVSSLSMDFRLCVDTMTTETTCWSSIWQSDSKVKEFFEIHNRPAAYREILPAPVAFYDRVMTIDLSKIKAMIAMPFHPSNAYAIEDVQKNPADILHEVQKEGQKLFEHSDLKFDLMSKIKDNRVVVEQGIIGSCAGGSFENINAAADILAGKSIGSEFFNMSVYPFSNPVYLELMKNGSLQKLIEAGAVIKPAICGFCFGMGDIPANGELSVRHATRNFPNREGSLAGDRQLCSTALMDARSVAATALRGGVLTAATELDVEYHSHSYYFDGGLYNRRSYNGQGRPRPEIELQMGPDIKDWPTFYPMEKAVLLKLVSVFPDPVITTDDLIPSYASSFRSDPERMSEHALALRDPNFVPASKAVRRLEKERRDGALGEELAPLFEQIRSIEGCQALDWKHISIGSAICGNKVGDGSAREVAASCQRVQGALANLAAEFATKRFVSNLKNWGILPLLLPQNPGLSEGDYIFLPDISNELADGTEKITAYWIRGRNVLPLLANLAASSKTEREILRKGGLINYYRAG